MWRFPYDYSGEGNLTRVRLAVVWFLVAIAIWVTPKSWQPWIYGAVAVAAMCACIYAIFFVKRNRPWNRRNRS